MRFQATLLGSRFKNYCERKLNCMKKAALFLLATVFGCIFVSCLSASKRTNVQTDEMKLPLDSVTPTNKEWDFGDSGSTKEFESIMLGVLKRESQTLGIKNLREAKIDDETEVRIWMMFDVALPRCFILKENNGDYKAIYAAAVKGKKGIPKATLTPPHSGWDEFDGFLKEQGVDVPIKLSLDEKTLPEEDIVLIEGKSGVQYSMVFFFTNTKSEDGQKALKVCRRIEQEFSIRMGCE